MRTLERSERLECRLTARPRVKLDFAARRRQATAGCLGLVEQQEGREAELGHVSSPSPPLCPKLDHDGFTRRFARRKRGRRRAFRVGRCDRRARPNGGRERG
jgi:hypothetical protein